MKDNFSSNSAQYLQYRPEYTSELIDLILSRCASREMVWDAGTGNGQLAVKLAPYFKKIYATDLSANQIENARKSRNIEFAVERAEHVSLPDHSVELITVAQAVHWFDFEKFYQEVRRVLKPNGLLVLIGYSLHRNPDLDAQTDRFYEFTGPYWDPERKYLDEHYHTIPFPFEELSRYDGWISVHWTFEQYIGYIKTWSAVKHFEKATGQNAVDNEIENFKLAWGDMALREIRFPLFARFGKVG
jgi:SAM-dependent methyltransferase